MLPFALINISICFLCEIADPQDCYLQVNLVKGGKLNAGAEWKKSKLVASPSFLCLPSSFKKSPDKSSSCDFRIFQMTESHVERVKLIGHITQSILMLQTCCYEENYRITEW